MNGPMGKPLKTIRLYMNVYQAGYYHRQGKPGCTNIHAGDFYATPEAAQADAEPGAGLIAVAVPFDMPVPDFADGIVVNGPESVPTPLSQTRKDLFDRLPWYTVAERLVPPVPGSGVCGLPDTSDYSDFPPVSLEPADDPVGESFEDWKARIAKGNEPTGIAAAYKPAHGGYPGVVR